MPRTSHARGLRPAFTAILLGLLLASSGHAADVNVLIIGSEKDSSDSRLLGGKSQAFSPAGVKTELQKILDGAGLGTVNVVLEERFNREGPYACYNLAEWFHWPYPADVETHTRWPNLRGEKGTTWDYVVLIGDPYTIEHMPGLYAHGVAKIAEEVAKGKAKTVLLMPWPGANSDCTVAHYSEVVFRTGRSGGLLVAPAGLSWESAGKPVGETHPCKDGAYIAAASIFSCIWRKSASTSTYRFNEKLADTAYKTITDNMGDRPYSGAFSFQNPFCFFGLKARTANPGKSPGGSSTESGLVNATQDAIRRAGATVGGQKFTIGRDSGGPQLGKDYRLGDRDFKKMTFAYRYQTNTGDPDIHLAQIFRQDIDLADQVMKESATYRCLPRRLIWAGLHQLDPAIKPMGGQGHISNHAHVSCGTFMYTLISGRCPVDPKPNPVTQEWLSQMVGYETAWHLAACQIRAPGFKVLPTDVAADGKLGTNMTVQFLLPPQQQVMVNVTCTDGVAIAAPATLTFTPANYNVPQDVLVKAVNGAKPGTSFAVQFRTTSQDQVYDGLSDSWDYQVNNRPVADDRALSAYAGRPVATLLTGSDANGQTLNFSIVEQPRQGTVTLEGAKALYSANAVGSDSFTFKANDGLEDSDTATVSIDVKARSLYDFNLLVNPTADLGLQGWTTEPNTDGLSAQPGGTNGVAFFRAEGSDTAGVYQDVDVSAYAHQIGLGKQSFRFAGHRMSDQETHFIVEFMNKDKQVLKTYDSGDTPENAKDWVKTEKVLSAPVNTTTIRVRMRSIRRGGRHNTGSFDELLLVAVTPDA